MGDGRQGRLGGRVQFAAQDPHSEQGLAGSVVFRGHRLEMLRHF